MSHNWSSDPWTAHSKFYLDQTHFYYFLLWTILLSFRPISPDPLAHTWHCHFIRIQNISYSQPQRTRCQPAARWQKRQEWKHVKEGLWNNPEFRGAWWPELRLWRPWGGTFSSQNRFRGDRCSKSDGTKRGIRWCSQAASPKLGGSSLELGQRACREALPCCSRLLPGWKTNLGVWCTMPFGTACAINSLVHAW